MEENKSFYALIKERRVTTEKSLIEIERQIEQLQSRYTQLKEEASAWRTVEQAEIGKHVKEVAYNSVERVKTVKIKKPTYREAFQQMIDWKEPVSSEELKQLLGITGPETVNLLTYLRRAGKIESAGSRGRFKLWRVIEHSNGIQNRQDESGDASEERS